VHRPRLLALLLALATLIIYLPATRNGFVNFDDDDYITNNPVVKAGLTLAGIKWAFTTGHASNWHPLTWLSHMTDCQWFGLNPAAHHFVNALLHAANSALVFWLVLRLTQRFWPCVFIAALFAWHPLHVESVAWASERKDVLSTFFALLALLSYVQFAKESSRRHYWLALLFFTLGLLAKPMLVTLPFVFLLLDVWPLQRLNTEQIQPSSFKPLITEKIPFLLLTAASCAVTFLVQQKGEAVATLAKVSLRYRLENAPVAVTGYLEKLFWPANLSIFYPLPDEIPTLKFIFSVLVLILISALAWRWRQARPYFLIGWLWFLGTLVPVIGLVQVGGQALADRYTYIPSIGFFLAANFLLAEWFGKIQTPKLILGALMILILTACIFATERQIQFWHDGESLFRRAVGLSPDNDVALVDLGVALDAQYRFDEALEFYKRAEKIAPSRFQIHNNLGNILSHLGRHAESLAEYKLGIQQRPDSAPLHNSAGTELVALNNFSAAIQEFAAAAQLDSTYGAPHLELGKLLFRLGREADGLTEFRAAVQRDPENYQTLATVAHYLAAAENVAVRDPQDALPLALKANELSGHSQPMVFDILGMALAANGDFTNAAVCAQNALTLANAAKMKNTGQIQERLELYQKNQPWRESFLATNAPPKN
jgi:protein O-mannosyl-transferase